MYDAPIKYKGQGADAVPLSQMALLLGEQIKNKYDVLDSVIVSLRINDEFTDDDSQGDEKVKEIHSDDENEPEIKCMFDGGAFDHIFGSDMTQSGMLTNIRKVQPVPCRIAKGFMWLDTTFSALSRGV